MLMISALLLAEMGRLYCYSANGLLLAKGARLVAACISRQSSHSGSLRIFTAGR